MSFRNFLAISVLALPATARALPPAPVLTFAQALGGSVVEPAQVAPYVYVATGTTITTYDYTNITRPLATGSTSGSPVRGAITAWHAMASSSTQVG